MKEHTTVYNLAKEMNLRLIRPLRSSANMLIKNRKEAQFELLHVYKISQIQNGGNSTCQIVQVHQWINCKEMTRIDR